jgi:Ca2+-binding EF-hand superfamily protein
MKASNLFTVGTAAVLLPLALFAQSATPQQQPATPAQSETPTDPAQRGTTFESLDADSDGKISKTEAEANANVKSQFSRYDVNGDGFIERAEVGQANGAQSAPPQQ